MHASLCCSAVELLWTQAVALTMERWRVLGFTICDHGLTGQTWIVGVGVGRWVLISSLVPQPVF